MSLHQALLIAEWGPTTLYLNGALAPDAAAPTQLRQRGIAVEPAAVIALHGAGPRLSAIELADGRTSEADALYLGPWTRLNSAIAEHLGCAMEGGPFGLIIRTDAQKMTTVPGVYAARGITRGAHNVTWACADGVMAAMAVHRSLIF